jgi:hypothetical protein
MKAWKWGLAVAVGWFVLLLAANFIHTEVVMKGKLSVEEDERVSRSYGEVAGYGTVLTGVATFLLLKSRE